VNEPTAQSPAAGGIVRKGSVTSVRLQTIRYIERKPELTTYALIPAHDERSFGDYWECRISPDRKSVVIRAIAVTSEERTIATMRGELRENISLFGEAGHTFALSGFERGAVGAIRIPADGAGRGELYVDGVWFYRADDPRKQVLEFRLKKPEFR
jgi:hypothetical protein